MERSLAYWGEMFDLIVEMQKRLFTLIEEQAEGLPGVKQAKAAMQMMPDLGPMQNVVEAMQRHGRLGHGRVRLDAEAHGRHGAHGAVVDAGHAALSARGGGTLRRPRGPRGRGPQSTTVARPGLPTSGQADVAGSLIARRRPSPWSRSYQLPCRRARPHGAEVLRGLAHRRRRGLAAGDAAGGLPPAVPTSLPPAPPVPAWRRFLAQFEEPAGAAAGRGGSRVARRLGRSRTIRAAAYEALTILAIVALNSALGFVQEERAARAVAGLHA